jgi:hypothetical protein
MESSKHEIFCHLLVRNIHFFFFIGAGYKDQAIQFRIIDISVLYTGFQFVIYSRVQKEKILFFKHACIAHPGSSDNFVDIFRRIHKYQLDLCHISSCGMAASFMVYFGYR